jgi:hypothetical protein
MWEALKQGLVRGGRDILEGGAQIGARMGPEEGGAAFADPKELEQRRETVDEGVRQSAREYDANPAQMAHPLVAGGGRIAGNVLPGLAAGMAIPGGGPAAMAGRLMSSPLRTGAGLLAQGAISGAAAGVMQPVQAPDFWDEKIKQVGASTVAGAVLPGVGAAVSPRLPNPQLVDQMSGRLAQAFRPLYNFFTGAEERTTNGFDRTIARQVLEPVGGRIDGKPVGHELARQTQQQLDEVYDRILPNVQLDKKALDQANTEIGNYVATMSSDHIHRFNELMARQVDARFPKDGVMDGKTFQRMRSDLADRARAWVNTNDDELGHAVFMQINHMNNVIEQTNPAWAPQLKPANEAWRLWVRMRQAVNKSLDGRFSPEDMLRAIGTQDKGQTWKGDRPLQGYSIAAMKAMGPARTSAAELWHLFYRHGLIGQAVDLTAGRAARGGKAISPTASPFMGAAAARDIVSPPTPEQRSRDRMKVSTSIGQVRSDLYNATKKGDLEEVQKLSKKLSGLQSDYRQLGGGM